MKTTQIGEATHHRNGISSRSEGQNGRHVPLPVFTKIDDLELPKTPSLSSKDRGAYTKLLREMARRYVEHFDGDTNFETRVVRALWWPGRLNVTELVNDRLTCVLENKCSEKSFFELTRLFGKKNTKEIILREKSQHKIIGHIAKICTMDGVNTPRAIIEKSILILNEFISEPGVTTGIMQKSVAILEKSGESKLFHALDQIKRARVDSRTILNYLDRVLVRSDSDQYLTRALTVDEIQRKGYRASLGELSIEIASQYSKDIRFAHKITQALMWPGKADLTLIIRKKLTEVSERGCDVKKFAELSELLGRKDVKWIVSEEKNQKKTIQHIIDIFMHSPKRVTLTSLDIASRFCGEIGVPRAILQKLSIIAEREGEGELGLIVEQIKREGMDSLSVLNHLSTEIYHINKKKIN